MLLQPTARRWGAERELIYVKRGYSHTVAIFIWFYLDAFHNFVHVTIIRAQQGELRLKVAGIFFFFFFCRERERLARSFQRAGGPSTRPRQGDRASSAESAGRMLCNLSHKNTHTHTQINSTQGGRVRGALYKETFSRKGNSSPKKCYSCGSS